MCGGAAKQVRLSGCAQEAKLEPHPHTLPTHTPTPTLQEFIDQFCGWGSVRWVREGGRGEGDSYECCGSDRCIMEMQVQRAVCACVCVGGNVNDGSHVYVLI